ncbi:YihY/virulence factor BrkB family protein [Kineococcus gynurae]|uniref:YihY/virulence factor BrkB family protein n=1 Tax=Kineococcus gynurae TaxID=452979 RepID=A0ABV5LT29_9ACTN
MSTGESTGERAGEVVAAVKRSHVLRAWTRYSTNRGNALAGGIAYFAFFSVFPALVVGLTVFGFVLADNDAVRSSLIAGMNDYLPGLVRDGTSPATDPEPGIYVGDYLGGRALTIGLIVGLVTGLYTGLNWIDALRQGIRAIFGEDAGGAGFVAAKARDLVVLVVIGGGVVLSVLSVTVTGGAGGWLLGLVGVEDTAVGAFLVAVAGFAVALVIDSLTFLVVFRVMPGADVPLRNLRNGAILGGLGIGILKQFGTQIASRSAQGNALGAAAAGVVVLLVLMYLIARVVLLAAAWAATAAEDDGLLPPHGPALPPGGVVPAAQREAGPTTAVPTVPPGRPDHPARPARATDRVSVAAGVVVGAVGTGAVLALRRGARHLTTTWRRR